MCIFILDKAAYFSWFNLFRWKISGNDTCTGGFPFCGPWFPVGYLIAAASFDLKWSATMHSAWLLFLDSASIKIYRNLKTLQSLFKFLFWPQNLIFGCFSPRAKAVNLILWLDALKPWHDPGKIPSTNQHKTTQQTQQKVDWMRFEQNTRQNPHNWSLEKDEDTPWSSKQIETKKMAVAFPFNYIWPFVVCLFVKSCYKSFQGFPSWITKNPTSMFTDWLDWNRTFTQIQLWLSHVVKFMELREEVQLSRELEVNWIYIEICFPTHPPRKKKKKKKVCSWFWEVFL